MSYNRNIPQSTDLVSNSQPQILGNFQTIDAGSNLTGIGFTRNHVTMTDASNGGLHSRVDFYQAVADPLISGFVSSLYPKTVSNVELFYRNAAAITQLTGLTVITTGSGGNINYGVTTPWGIIINWGTVVPVNTGKPVVFAIPITGGVQSVLCTAQSTSTGNAANIITTANIGTTGFTAYSSGAPQSNYFAIGPK
jgi:hypothetical protein